MALSKDREAVCRLMSDIPQKHFDKYVPMGDSGELAADYGESKKIYSRKDASFKKAIIHNRKEHTEPENMVNTPKSNEAQNLYASKRMCFGGSRYMEKGEKDTVVDIYVHNSVAGHQGNGLPWFSEESMCDGRKDVLENDVFKAVENSSLRVFCEEDNKTHLTQDIEDVDDAKQPRNQDAVGTEKPPGEPGDLSVNPFYKRWYRLFFGDEKTSNESVRVHVCREMEAAKSRARKNEATLCSTKLSIFLHVKKSKMVFDDIALTWTEEDRALFERLFDTFGKNFVVISQLSNRDIKDCINYYYRTKKEKRYKKKVGKYSDEQLRIVVEADWDSSEMNVYHQCLKLYKGDVSKFSDMFLDKDLDMFKRYYIKFYKPEKDPKCKEGVPAADEGKALQSNVAESEQRTENSKKGRKKPSGTMASILSEWSMDERQLFAIYYPYLDRNWMMFAEYIKTKRMSDFSRYFRLYFKKLTRNEQAFETYQCELEKDRVRNLFTGRKKTKRPECDMFMNGVGIVSKPRQRSS